MTEHTITEPAWIATEATVTTCHYQARGLSVLAFGIQTGERFRITFDYYAHGQLYSGEFQSPNAIPQNQRIPITYNPLHPEENSRTHEATSTPTSTRAPIVVIGVTGSIILALLWLAILRGCR